ncbi:MAG: aminodeoxychorismate synthase component I [Turicibacter sp.]|nr:aminodeoxychorismate synthase component I [Turicibacter sp.]
MKEIHWRSLPYDRDFFEQYLFLAEAASRHILLESGRQGRFSLAGFDPVAHFTGKDGKTTQVSGGKAVSHEGNPMDALKRYMKENYVGTIIPGIPFVGGAVGYLSYDYVRYLEKLPPTAHDDLGLFDLEFLVFDDVAVYDQHKKQLWLITAGKADPEGFLDDWQRQWETVPALATGPRQEGLPEHGVSFGEDDFCQAVERIQEYIKAGDVFQVNLAVRQSEKLLAPPIDIYKQVRRLNPSPYMAYLKLGHMEVVSCSPELLIKKEGKTLSTRPIAGTRSRGANDGEDLKLAMELIENEKERAEHVMLVDLERNDLGKVSQYGSVHVDELMAIEKYSHVQHIVSNVTSQIADEYDVYDAIDAMFPGGTITGAPKIRCMEIIEELEPVRRGLYTGAIGWIGYNEDAEFNIVIRTLVAKDGMAHIQAGAGVVIDSVPKREYAESLKKARALWHAKELADEREGSL